VNALRSKGLDIRPTKQGNQKFIKGYELRWLDDLNEHLKQDGATLANFDPSPERPVASVDTMVVQGSSENQLQEVSHEAMSIDVRSLSPDILELAQAIALALRPSDPFSHYEQLERFAKHGWLIQSKELRELIGKQPKGSWFKWGGFTMERKGRWWSVVKD
jgi:hypothetical protein